MRHFSILFLVVALLSTGVGSPRVVAQNPVEITKRLTEKVQRIQEGAQKWAASGRDPSEIAKTMQEKFQPLMEAGKIVEAEALLDKMLKLLGVDAKVPANEASIEERVLVRIHKIQKELPVWTKKP